MRNTLIAMIISDSFEDLQPVLFSKLKAEGIKARSRFGETVRGSAWFAVVKKPGSHDVMNPDMSGWNLSDGETYLTRVEPHLPVVARKLSEVEFTRRMSIPVWMPHDHFSRTPPAITEISCMVVEKRIHLTAFVRSLDVINYLMSNGDFLKYVMDWLVDHTPYRHGTIGLVIGVPHFYIRDSARMEEVEYREVYGVTEYGAHIKENYLSTAWHSALEGILNLGFKKPTEWGEFFEGQKESMFIHRLMIEVSDPDEHEIHDKAPFSRDYGVDYAHDYLICAGYIDRRVDQNILKDGEVYSYAERARYCLKDEKKVDQLYECINKLTEDRWRRDAYVGISRPWDLEHDDPPCLRGYMFFAESERRLCGMFYMRSNDAYGAMHANMFGFNLLTRYVRDLTSFESHRLVHFALDAHIYGEFYDSVRELLYPEMPSFSAEITGRQDTN